VNVIIRICLSALLGYFVWSGTTWHVGLSILAPILWYTSSNRLIAAGVMTSYHTAASHALPYGITIYYGTPLIGGVGLWLISGLLMGSVWGLCWNRSASVRILLLPVALFLTAVPPVGLVGWCHPIVGAGILFPSCGIYGLLLAMLVMVLIMRLPFYTKIGACGLLALWAFCADAPNSEIEGWAAIQTSAGAYQDDILTANSWDRNRELAEMMLEKLPATVIVSPESSAGRWHGMVDQFWRGVSERNPEVSFLIGAEYRDPKSGHDNVLLCAKNGEVGVLYRQRMPVPLTMWNPFKADSVNAYWFSGAVTELEGNKVGFLICYEQLLPWVVLHSLCAGAEVLVGSANDWWAAEGNIPEIQYATMYAWARLFGCPLVASFNL